MANAFLKSTVIVNAAVGLLRRQIVTPSLFWRDGLTNFQGGVGDTITLRLPAYANARTRTLRTAGPLVMDELHERAIDVKITTDVYHGVKVTDENMTFDIENFGAQILSPSVDAVARKIEDLAVATMTGTTYNSNITMNETDPLAAVRAARVALNQANVPMTDRYIAMGSAVESALLSSNLLLQVNTSGSSEVLREATTGRLFGFTFVTVPALPPNTAIAFHKTAFAMASRAPVVPAGAAFGQAVAYDGLAGRWIRDYDALNTTDRSIFSTYVGFAPVTDQGVYVNGRFEPATVPDAEGDDILMIRAAKITLVEDSP